MEDLAVENCFNCNADMQDNHERCIVCWFPQSYKVAPVTPRKPSVASLSSFEDVVKGLGLGDWYKRSQILSEPLPEGQGEAVWSLLLAFNEQRMDDFYSLLFLITKNDMEVSQVLFELLHAVIGMTDFHDGSSNDYLRRQMTEQYI